MDTKAKGIVVRLIDYKDADKLASIFSVEYGLITAKFVGVKRDKAKMKAVAQPFTFAEFTFAERCGRVVTGADIIDSFSSLQTNYDKMMCGYIILDMIKSILPEEKPESDLFLLTLNALKNLETNSEYEVLIKYILDFVDFSGLKVEFSNVNYVYFDKFSGNFTAERTFDSIEIDKRVYQYIKNVNEMDFAQNCEEQITPVGQRTNQVQDQTKKQALRLLHNMLLSKFNVDIKSFDFI